MIVVGMHWKVYKACMQVRTETSQELAKRIREMQSINHERQMFNAQINYYLMMQ